MFYRCQRFTTNQCKDKRKGSNKRSKVKPKAALVWHTGLSGAPPNSVRCTREDSIKLASFGNSGSRSAIIHRTVRCASGAMATLRQQLSVEALNALQCAPARAEVRAGARRRTRQSTGPVRCTTELPGGPTSQSSNGRTLTVW
jgi:hypothetical protein